MALNRTVERLGRRIRVGVVGGGEGALIGGAHRAAMRFDDHFEICAGVLSSDPKRSLEQAGRVGIGRGYGDFPAMLAAERGRADGIDVVAIMTPNDTHAAIAIGALRAGYHVICDKPLANTLGDAAAVRRAALDSGRLLCVTYTYSGYPLVRQARAMVAAGAVGTPHLVQVRYAQGNLGTLVERSEALSPQLRWRLDPERGGTDNLLLDVGTHAHHLATYVTGRPFTQVRADLVATVPGRRFADTATVLGRLAGDVRAELSITKAATGAPQVFGIEVYGDEGGIRWEQATPNALLHMRPGRPTETYGRDTVTLDGDASRSVHAPFAHPEGFREAFANVYADFADAVSSFLCGEGAAVQAGFPDGQSGERGLAWVEACHRSSRSGQWETIAA